MGLISPTLPTSGQDRGAEEIDVLNTLTALVNVVNGSLDDANIADNSLTAASIATAAKPVTLLGAYRSLSQVVTHVADGPGATYLLSNSSGFVELAGVGTTSGENYPSIIFDPADYSVSGLTTKLRIRAAYLSNATAAAVTITPGLYPVTFAGGANVLGPTLGTVVSGSAVAITTPPASTATVVAGTDFTTPSAGVYAFGVVLSGTTAANHLGNLVLDLQLHHV